jgi:hypothetical protein
MSNENRIFVDSIKNMTNDEKTYSFMNMWFIFKKNDPSVNKPVITVDEVETIEIKKPVKKTKESKESKETKESKESKEVKEQPNEKVHTVKQVII